jgi:SAM-dependent methyltransferase
MTDQVAYWNARAGLGAKAGSQDVIAAELERRCIAKYVKPRMCVMDVGCGNGTMAIWLTDNFDVGVWGFDPAIEMIHAANETAFGRKRRPMFLSGGVLDIGDFKPAFDLIYTQRVIVNLPDWPTQRAAIERIISWLRPGGTYLAVECSQDGLDRTNELRAMVDLPEIQPPSHNRYLRDDEMRLLAYDLGGREVAWMPEDYAICGTYQLLSRVVNARLAADAGEQPRYDAPVNQLALRLPNLAEIGQNRVWVWRRCP